jgi:hypothetical protein
MAVNSAFCAQAIALSGPTGNNPLVTTQRRRETHSMAIHLTPTELAREAGMHRREVIVKCMELGVPIFQGRIDKTLFLSSLKEAQSKTGVSAPRAQFA